MSIYEENPQCSICLEILVQNNEGNTVKWQTLLDTYALIPLQ